MKRDNLRVAIAPNMESPRQADCFDVQKSKRRTKLVHLVNEPDNKLSINDAKRLGQENLNVNTYAAWKELFLGYKCKVQDEPKPWNFWMIMLKSGNMDTTAAICPKNGKPSQPFPQESSQLKESFHGTWDLLADMSKAETQNDTSFFKVTWHKNLGKGSWKFHHILKTSSKYPWLMLYLRSDATIGVSGGYHYETRGMSKISPNFKVKFTLDIKRGGGPSSQFYLMDMGSCWKNNGQPCDGDVTTDVTHYTMPTLLAYHTSANGIRVHRTDEARFPYDAYHVYCSPCNGKYIEEPFNYCDEYSNPQAQEILQILPHPVWGEYVYPTKKGEGWIGDPRTWELDVGRLSQSLYFYQDPGPKPVERH
ncbi:hypothetical protein K7X08_012216 [Anisodus acutangulus]|uniref:DUF7705 domain-containing protein n=1 Tax=Anisodus acutangulus TaxID=402998 RepID=A0A9Q1LCG4_9SOLA|nr:hypothetical protein K7X08_012216 [Anisodus acutangulus]